MCNALIAGACVGVISLQITTYILTIYVLGTSLVACIHGVLYT